MGSCSACSNATFNFKVIHFLLKDVGVGIKPGKIVKLTFAQQAGLDLGMHDGLKPDRNFQSRLKRAEMYQNSVTSVNR